MSHQICLKSTKISSIFIPSFTIHQIITKFFLISIELPLYPFASLPLKVHSLRAVPVPAARQLVQFAFARRLPLHLHLEEQPAELEQCNAVDQRHREPSEVLLEDVLPVGIREFMWIF